MADEVEHLKNYAFLIQKRYDGTLNIHVYVDSSLSDETLPKFTLQPLVENCVKHGFRPSIPDFTVHVTISGTCEHWKIRIEDNGIGFSEKSLEEISVQLQKCDCNLQNQNDIVNQKIGNLALSNIYIRCRILYKEHFHFYYGNHPDAPGAFVELDLNKKEI